MFPSIWIGRFANGAEYTAARQRIHDALAVFDTVDDRLLYSRHAMTLNAWCACCRRVTPMHIDWSLGAAGAGSVHPAWTETGACTVCGLNSRMRALIDFLHTQIEIPRTSRLYIAEQKTAAFRRIRALFGRTIGSEYLGPEYTSGQIVRTRFGRRLRHEDMTALSFADATFSHVITQDVFEHVPNYRQAFREVARVLKPGGRLIFTIPFFPFLEHTQIRAELTPEGIVHHLPPEIHGNPVSEEGALCFQNFGWDIVEELRTAGLASAYAHLYWGPWQGHLGAPFFVFSAQR